MTRWQFLNRLLGAPARRRGNRFAPRLEQLEARENPAVDVIFNGAVPEFNEGASFLFGSAAFFSIDNQADPSGVVPHTATVIAQNGVLNVNAGNGPTVTGSGTSTVTLVGTRDEITQLFLGSTGTIEFAPNVIFSGDGLVTVSATDGSTSDTEATFLKVQPVLSQTIPAIFGDPGAELFLTPAGFDGFAGVAVADFGTLLDSDGSELVGFFITASDSQGGALPAFTLLSNGSEYPTSGMPNTWFVGSNDFGSLRGVLESFVLVPPPGFSGRVNVTASGAHQDFASFFDTAIGFDSASLGSTTFVLRFFQEPQVSVVPGLAPEGGTIDLTGRFALSDSSTLDGDAHTFRVAALAGALNFDETNPILSDLSFSATETEVVLTGNLSVIQEVLNSPGVLSFTANDAFFSGVLPLSVVLVNRPFDRFFEGDLDDLPFGPLAFDELAPMGITPVAAQLDPVVADATGDAGALIALNVAVPPVVDTDGSESATVFITDVPDTALLSAGTNLGDGVWALDASQLPGLAFLSSVGGTFTMTAFVMVRDVSFQLGLEDVAFGSASFTVTLDDSDSFGDTDDGDTDPTFADFGGGSELDSGTSEFIDNEDFDPDVEADAFTDSPASIGAFNLVEVPANARDAGTPTDAGANPGGPREQALAPIYGDGEKHPLPPVLPLDQSVPVAGFSDSGGDTFALLDRLYRVDTGAQPVAVEVPALPPAALAEAPPPHELTAPVAGASAPPAANGEDPVAAPVDVDAGANWHPWAVAAAAVAGAAAAGALYARTRRASAEETPARATRARLKPLERTT
jgi:hypothetical protein